jgi:hypothetical protein
MARPAGLTRPLAALAIGVLVAHGIAVEWFARRLATLDTAMKPMVAPMYTRVLEPARSPPPPPVATVKPPGAGRATRAPRPATPASSPRPASETVEALAQAEPPALEAASPASAPEPAVAASGATGAPEASAPATVASPAGDPAPASTAKAPAPPDLWPTDSRLNYRLGGMFRGGELYGDARVQWQREGSKYQVRVEVDIALWASLVMTSQGEVRADGLSPRVYEEVRPNRRRTARLDETTVWFENGKTHPRPEGVQDTASQFVDLGHCFASGECTAEVGRTVSVWLARPANVDLWTYDIVALDTLQTPRLGAVQAYHLKPRPIANPRGNIHVEMWFAPSLQYLPVRVRINMGESDHLDLMVDNIQQR